MSLKLTFNATVLTSKHAHNSGMLTLTHSYRIYPDSAQEQQLIEWMEICRGAFNYALREIKDWCDSRKCPIDRCSLEKEYIIISWELQYARRNSTA
jgi:putative transposase